MAQSCERLVEREEKLFSVDWEDRWQICGPSLKESCRETATLEGPRASPGHPFCFARTGAFAYSQTQARLWGIRSKWLRRSRQRKVVCRLRCPVGRQSRFFFLGYGFTARSLAGFCCSGSGRTAIRISPTGYSSLYSLYSFSGRTAPG